MNILKTKDKNYYSVTKPITFMSLSKKVLPILLIIISIFSSAGLYLGVFFGPSDFQQGEVFKIIYIHVPAAWMALSLYTILSIISVIFLVTKNPILSLTAHTIAQQGTLFTGITLFTGSLWGAPTWGTFWVWDARLTSVLILFIIYLTYLIIYSLNTEFSKISAAFFAIIGFINIPIIKYSVNWWTTLHQPASITISKVAIDFSILMPLFFMILAFITYTIYINILYVREHLIFYKTNITNKK